MRNKQLKNVTVYFVIIMLLFITLMQFNVFKKEENFKILKAEKINKIFISDMYGNNIIIQKEIDKWTVNNKHEANLEIIERLISDLEKIEIKYPVSKNSINTVTKEMAIKSGFNTPKWFLIKNTDDLISSINEISKEGILKTNSLGYDGKGQLKIDKKSTFFKSWEN